MRRLLLWLSGFVLLCTLCFLTALFVLDLACTNSSYAGLRSSDVVLEEDRFSVQLDTGDSSPLFKRCRYQVEENTLYLTVYTGYLGIYTRCRPWPVTVRIQDAALAQVDQICLRNGDSVKKIYPN